MLGTHPTIDEYHVDELTTNLVVLEDHNVADLNIVVKGRLVITEQGVDDPYRW